MNIVGTIFAILLVIGWPAWVLARSLRAREQSDIRRGKVVGLIFFVLSLILLFNSSPEREEKVDNIIEIAWYIVSVWPWMDILLMRFLPIR